MFLQGRGSQVLSFVLLAYVSTAVIFTTYSLVVARIVPNFSPKRPENIAPPMLDIIFAEGNDLSSAVPFFPPSTTGPYPDNNTSKARSAFTSSNALSSYDQLLLSKAFSGSLQPSDIIPFYYRHVGQFDDDDITITTLLTVDRFPVFAQLVENYAGELSLSSR